jgi:DNA-binding GntR family transcriptional regulator
VRVLGEDDIRDLYRVRRVLETEGARASAGATDASIAHVVEALERLTEAMGSDPDSSWHAIEDMRFHATVVALAGSPRLDAFFGRIGVEMTYAIRLLHRDEIATGMDRDDLVDEHSRIVRAVQARDRESALRAVEEHIDANEARLQRITRPSSAPASCSAASA